MPDIIKAIKALRDGDLVAFPTETVYGLGADATNPDAIHKVFTTKGRPADHPVIVHIATIAALNQWSTDIPPLAFTLAEKYWPGPMTLILRKHPQVSSLITGGQDTIAIRIPNHPLTLRMLQGFEGAIVGPSANKYGRVSPTTAAHVQQDLNGEVAVILDGGACTYGIESTILDLSSNHIIMRRRGSITAEQIKQIIGVDVTFEGSSKRVPGSDKSHYAPVTPVILVKKENLIAKLIDNCSVLSLHTPPQDLSPTIYWQQVANDPQKYSHDLYANLRKHDSLNKELIIIEYPDTQDAWLAIIDRLTRASSSSF